MRLSAAGIQFRNGSRVGDDPRLMELALLPLARGHHRNGKKRDEQFSLHRRENTYNEPPLVLLCGRSFMTLTNPRAAVGSVASRSPATMAPAHPPTPDSTATYCLPSGPL